MTIAMAITARRIPHVDRNFILRYLLGCAEGLRVASTFRLPHLLHRSRFTKPTIGVPGVIARRNLSSGWRHSVRLSQAAKSRLPADFP